MSRSKMGESVKNGWFVGQKWMNYYNLIFSLVYYNFRTLQYEQKMGYSALFLLFIILVIVIGLVMYHKDSLQSEDVKSDSGNTVVPQVEEGPDAEEM